MHFRSVRPAFSPCASSIPRLESPPLEGFPWGRRLTPRAVRSWAPSRSMRRSSRAGSAGGNGLLGSDGGAGGGGSAFDALVDALSRERRPRRRELRRELGKWLRRNVERRRFVLVRRADNARKRGSRPVGERRSATDDDDHHSVRPGRSSCGTSTTLNHSAKEPRPIRASSLRLMATAPTANQRVAPSPPGSGFRTRYRLSRTQAPTRLTFPSLRAPPSAGIPAVYLRTTPRAGRGSSRTKLLKRRSALALVPRSRVAPRGTCRRR